jgi:hypothetical protein
MKRINRKKRENWLVIGEYGLEENRELGEY